MFTELVIGQNLTQLVKDPTRFAPNAAPPLLDLFLTNHPEWFVLIVEAPLGTSDHAVVTAEFLHSSGKMNKQSGRQISSITRLTGKV